MKANKFVFQISIFLYISYQNLLIQAHIYIQIIYKIFFQIQVT